MLACHHTAAKNELSSPPPAREPCRRRDSQDRLRPQLCLRPSSSSSPRPPPRLLPRTSSSTCVRTAPWPPPRPRSSAGLSHRRPPPHPLGPSSCKSSRAPVCTIRTFTRTRSATRGSSQAHSSSSLSMRPFASLQRRPHTRGPCAPRSAEGLENGQAQMRVASAPPRHSGQTGKASAPAHKLQPLA